MDRQAAMGRLHGDSRCQRRLAHAAFAHQHEQPVSICRDAIDEVGHAGLIQFNGGIGCDMRLWRQVGQQLPEGVEADEIEGLELDKVARKRNQHGKGMFLSAACSRSWIAAASGSLSASTAGRMPLMTRCCWLRPMAASSS